MNQLIFIYFIIICLFISYVLYRYCYYFSQQSRDKIVYGDVWFLAVIAPQGTVR